MVSSSGGGRFERDQAAATFWKRDQELERAARRKTDADDTCELVDIRLFGVDEVSEGILLAGGGRRGRGGGGNDRGNDCGVKGKGRRDMLWRGRQGIGLAVVHGQGL